MNISGASSAVKAVLFDLYGTLVDVTIDTRPARIWKAFAEEIAVVGGSLSADDLRRRYHDQVSRDTREHGEAFVLNTQFFYQLLQNGDQPNSDFVRTFARRFRQLTTRSISLRRYGLPLLSALRSSGCKIGLVSNTDAHLTDHDLDVLKLRDHFDTIVLSSQVGVKKPDPRIFRIALRRLGVQSHDAIHIGDDYTADLLGATGAELRALLLGDSRPASVQPRLPHIVEALQRHGWTGYRQRTA
jgi:putative hydrolase of the HAD superfamily